MDFQIYREAGGLIAELVSTVEAEGFERCAIDPAALGIENTAVRIRGELPIRDVVGYWHPAMIRPKLKLDWNIEAEFAAQFGYPYLALFSDDQFNRCGIGSSELILETGLACRMNQETGCCEIEFRLAPKRPFDLFVDLRRAISWEVSQRDYLAFVRPDFKPDYPAAAWEPVYCTWYAVHAAVTQEFVETNAAAAAGLGFGTLIVDDGWCFDTMKRVTPETIGEWYDEIGEWEVSKAKFPDFAGHVRRVKELGLKYLLWTAPFMIGTRSSAAETVRLMGEVVTAYRETDPADEAGMKQVMARLLKLMDYGIDGLKVDFIDTIAPQRGRPCAELLFRFMKELAAGVKAAAPAGLIEYRQRYTSPQLLDCATQFRAGDVPFDYLDNFNRIGQIRRIVGDGVPVHADPVYWAACETEENIARHLVAALAGVPMASMDLTRLTTPELEIFRHYLGFYRDKLDIYRQGRWSVTYRGDQTAVISGCHDGETLAVAADYDFAAQLAAAPAGKLHLLNLSPRPIPAARACDIFDGRGRQIDGKVIPVGGRAAF